jgi:prepilin-type N-terminal cleavage/methylation domain-containing protein
MNRMSESRGFTLTEIMVSLTLCTVVSFFSYQIFRADSRVFVEQIEVANMQQNARMAMDQLVRDLRIAGLGVPIGGVNSDIGILYAVKPGNGANGVPDTLTVLSNFSNIQTELAEPMSSEGSSIRVKDVSGFTVGALAIISGPTLESGEHAEVFQITSVSDGGQNVLEHHQSLPWNNDQRLACAYTPPAAVRMVSYRQYYLDATDSSHPKLMTRENAGDPQVISDDVENLQIVYDLLTGEKDLPDPDSPTSIRKATVTIVARTDTPDPQWNNGIHSLTGANDHFRRLMLQSDVQVRNLNR